MKRLTLEELKTKGVNKVADLNAIKGGNLDKCHSGSTSEPVRTGGIPAEY